MKALYASHGIKPSPASSSAEKYKAPPPCNYTAPPAYSREAYRSPLSAKPILMVATTKPVAKALPSNFTRPPTPPVPETLLQTVPKPPPPPVPIGPALPEGQAPPYAVQQEEEPSAAPPRWALGRFKQVHRSEAHRLAPVVADLPRPPPPAVGSASSRLPKQPPAQRASSSITLPEDLTTAQAARRQDLTTIAIHPWPS